MQGAKPVRMLAERTVDYGLAAMEYCETLPRGALVGHWPSVSTASSQLSAASVRGRFRPLLLVAERWLLPAETLREANLTAALRRAARSGRCGRIAESGVVGAYAHDQRQHQHGKVACDITSDSRPRGVGGPAKEKKRARPTYRR